MPGFRDPCIPEGAEGFREPLSPALFSVTNLRLHQGRLGALLPTLFQGGPKSPRQVGPHRAIPFAAAATQAARAQSWSPGDVPKGCGRPSPTTVIAQLTLVLEKVGADGPSRAAHSGHTTALWGRPRSLRASSPRARSRRTPRTGNQDSVPSSERPRGSSPGKGARGSPPASQQPRKG